MEILKKIMEAFDDLPDMVQAFIFVSIISIFWIFVLG